jgi:hypothetical protein
MVYAEGTGKYENLYKVRYSKAAVLLISTDCEYTLKSVTGNKVNEATTPADPARWTV